MAISQISGAVRLRRFQIGAQSVLGTAVAATRRVPWRGPIVVNPNRTDPDVDVGSIDPVLPPYATATDVTWPPTGLVMFNDLPIRLAASLKGGVTATGAGTAKTWDYQVASLTSDDFDIFTCQFGDDTEATDGIIAQGGLIDSWEETMPQDLGPWTFSDGWVFAGASLAQNLTDGLSVDDDPTFAFGADTVVYMDTVAGSIGITPLVDTIHAVTIRGANNIDRKRFANGSNTRFALSGYGRGPRTIELVLTVAKTAAMIAERATLDDDPVPARYFNVETTSTRLAQAANPYSYKRRGAFRLFEAGDAEVGGNAVITLTYRAFYDSGLGYAYRATVVNTQATVAAAPA